MCKRIQLNCVPFVFCYDLIYLFRVRCCCSLNFCCLLFWYSLMLLFVIAGFHCRARLNRWMQKLVEYEKKTRVSSVLPTAYRSFSLSHELSHSIGIALIPSKLNFLNNFFDYRSLLVLRCYIRFLLFDFFG